MDNYFHKFRQELFEFTQAVLPVFSCDLPCRSPLANFLSGRILLLPLYTFFNEFEAEWVIAGFKFGREYISRDLGTKMEWI